MTQQLYFNGDPIEAPVLTDLEKKLAEQLSHEDFGDSSSADVIKQRIIARMASCVTVSMQ